MKETGNPSTAEAKKERIELLKFIGQSQNQIFLAQQRIAFLNGVLTERGVDINSQANDSDNPK